MKCPNRGNSWKSHIIRYSHPRHECQSRHHPDPWDGFPARPGVAGCRGCVTMRLTRSVLLMLRRSGYMSLREKRRVGTKTRSAGSGLRKRLEIAGRQGRRHPGFHRVPRWKPSPLHHGGLSFRSPAERLRRRAPVGGIVFICYLIRRLSQVNCARSSPPQRWTYSSGKLEPNPSDHDL